ncbi:MAG: hypothetical protein WAW73_02435 [Rhodoferax sp.]
MNPQNAQWLLLVLVNIPVYLGLGRIIFTDWDGFIEALRLWTSADWWLTLEKQWRLDRWSTAKLPVFVLACVALVVLEHLMFGKGKVVRPAAQLVGLL